MPADAAAPAPTDSAPGLTTAVPKSRRRILILAGAAALVLVLGVTAALALPPLFAPASTGIVTADFTQQPTVGAWELQHPLLDRALTGETLLTDVFTIGQDTALVYWSAVQPEIETVTMSAVSLIDTRNGQVFWTIDDSPAVAGLVGWTDSTVVVYSETSIYALDRGTGEFHNTTPDWQAAYPAAFGANGVVDGIVLGFDGLEIAALRADDLSVQWTADAPNGLSGVAGDLAIIGGAAYELETGENSEWFGDSDLRVVELGGVLLGQSDDSIVALADDGTELWRHPIEGEGVFTLPLSGTIVFGDSEGAGVATALDATSGDVLWQHPYSNASYYQALGSDGRYIVPTTPFVVSGVDARTGADLFDFEIDNSFLIVIGSAKNVFYEFGGGGYSLFAHSWSTGEVLWTIDNPQDNWYEFEVAGGNLIAAIGALDSDDLRSSGVAALVGIG